ncbi:esterase/lipase family protein [Desmospora activa]|uniref:AB hydrolase-1 domain-containing protein n=1 Tax=Desmospora activa DSM 45169 TaxID=1121389 RepID=A0A2T4Z6I7_9BACL|nr:alpha/beta fold hydrolase [Desmospora activa]PTM57496.1 hypothetical protein C8J48_0044 [Desmospora activa DSM 45169]
MRGKVRAVVSVLFAFLLALPVGMMDGLPVEAGEVVQPLGGKGDPCDRTPGTWFVEVPANPDPSKPPLVFVQGLNGCSDSWFGETQYYGANDMAAIARQNGYRTVFVDLHDSGGSAANQWDNGRMLADLLGQIYNRYGQRVNIVAHSKGGIDTQAALIHHGAHPYVGRVITLGSPHHGSHLADLAYSSWAGWLAELLGARSPGTESLQVGNMEQFRAVTDSHTNATRNSYYTTAGTSWGPTFSALWTGGAYLSTHGSNDGLVNVWSASLPYGNHLFTAGLDHDNIRLGREVFHRIEPTLRSTMTASQTATTEVAASAESNPNAGDQLVRGGPLAAGEEEVVTTTVTSGTEEAIFTLMTASENVQVELTSPSGKRYNSQSDVYGRSSETVIFQDATVQAFRIDQPEAGTWTIRFSGESEDAYLLTGTYLAPQSLSLEIENQPEVNHDIPLRLKIADTDLGKAKDLKVDVQVTPPGAKGTVQSAPHRGLLKADANGKALSGKLPRMTKPGVYNLTIDVTGTDAQGQTIERTIIRSVYVGDQDQ